MDKKESSINAEKRATEFCICNSCPSLLACKLEAGKTERCFCLPGHEKSENITSASVCVCGGCLTHEMMFLANHSYCIKGNELLLTKKSSLANRNKKS